MASSTLPAIERARVLPARRWMLAGEPFSLPVDPPPPGPGDPEVPYVPAEPRRLGRRAQLLLTQPTTHLPLTTIETALVQTVTFRYGPGSLSATAASVDPAWEVTGSESSTAYGRTVHKPDLKSVDWAVGVDGVRFSSGVFKEPQRGPGGVWNLSGDTGEAVLDERALGETEQRDYYGGRGAWPTTDLAGWSFEPNIDYEWNTTSPYEGARSLRVRATGAAPGHVYGPWVLMPGQPGQVRYPVASAVVRIRSDLVMQVMCEVRGASMQPINQEFTISERGVSDDSDDDWQVVRGRGRLTPTDVVHRVRWVGVIPASGDWVDIDLARIQWPTLTGFPSKRDTTRYPGRLLRDAQASALGGSSWGIATTVLELAGFEAKLTWPHQNDIPVGQAMREIREMVGGADWYISPGWRCLVMKERGQVRRDFALTPDNMIACEMAPDPGGEVDEFRGLTNLGSGSYRHVHGVDQPRRPKRRRIRQITSVPDELGYDAGRRWVQGQATTAAQPAWTATATIPFDEGLAITEGDVVPFAWVDGDAEDAPAWWGPVKVAEREFDFQAEVCRVSVGVAT